MLQVLNKDSDSIPKSCHEQLKEMGFSSQLIKQADYASNDKTVSGLLNWLITHAADQEANQQPDSQENDEIPDHQVRKQNKKAKNAKKLKNFG